MTLRARAYVQGRTAGVAPAMGGHAQSLFALIDADGNGTLDAAELAAAAEVLGDDLELDLSQADASGDGVVTPEQWAAFLAALEEAKQKTGDMHERSHMTNLNEAKRAGARPEGLRGPGCALPGAALRAAWSLRLPGDRGRRLAGPRGRAAGAAAAHGGDPADGGTLPKSQTGQARKLAR